MERTKKEVILGIVMAICFGLIGCVVWGVLYYINIIAGVAGFLILFLAGFAYKKWGNIKYFRKVDYLILIAISVVELIITILIVFGIIVQVTYSAYGETMGLFSAIKEMFVLASENSELMISIISDVAVSFIFLVGAIVYYIVDERKKRAKDIETIQNLNVQTTTENINTENINETPQSQPETTQETNQDKQ